MPFERTRRGLAADGFRATALALGAGGLLVAAWAVWFVAARVSVEVVSRSARLEVGSAVSPIQPSTAGRVVATSLVLGREVAAGEVLLELESDEERGRVEVSRARLSSLEAQIAALDAAIEAERSALAEVEAGFPGEVEEAGALAEEADARADLAEAEVHRLETLHGGGHLDLVRADANASRLAAAAEGMGREVERLALAAERAPIALDEARARAREADALAAYADEEVRRSERIVASGGHVAESELEAAKAEAARRKAAAEACAHAARRLEVEAREAVLSLEEKRAELRQAQGSAALAAEEASRLGRQGPDGRLVEIDVVRASAAARERRAAAEALRQARERLPETQRASAGDRRSKIEEKRRERARLEGELAGEAATVRRGEAEIERRRIRAPVAGRLSAVAADLRVGSVVSPGADLATVLPAGGLVARADFLAADALGRIRPGQDARVSLEGFPWTEFGMVPARVVRVAEEAIGGEVRVELELRPDPAGRIPLQHGMPGRVEVEVGRERPASLVLRAIGGWFERGEE